MAEEQFHCPRQQVSNRVSKVAVRRIHTKDKDKSPDTEPITTLPALPQKIQTKILQYLSCDDKKTCRLVCRDWNQQVSKGLAFGVWLNDGTASWIQNSLINFTYLAVSDLNLPLDYTNTAFALRIRMLIVECAKSTFEDGEDVMMERNKVLLRHGIHNGEGVDSIALFRPRTVESIDEKNLQWLLSNAKNVASLVFNNTALSNFSKCPSKAIIEENPFNNLYFLTIIVTGMEIYSMERLLNHHTFPKLANFCIRFYCLKRTYTVEQYESLFRFIYKHRKTLKILEIYDPPLQPSPKTMVLFKKPSEETCRCCECCCTTRTETQTKNSTNSSGNPIKKTTTTTATLTSDGTKKTIVKTTTVTTITSSSKPNLDKTKNQNTGRNSRNNRSKIKTTVEVYKDLLLELDEVIELTDLKLVFKQNVSTKWQIGIYLLLQQTHLQVLHCEGLTMPIVYSMIEKNAESLRLLEIHSPLTVPETTLITEPDSNMFDCIGLKKCINLSSLALHSFQHITCSFANCLPPSPNGIRVLELTVSGHMLWDQSMEAVAAKLWNLETLVVRSKRAVSDRFLWSFLCACPYLTRVFLSRISEDALAVLQEMSSTVYINSCMGDNWLHLTPTPNPDGTFPIYELDTRVIESRIKKKKIGDGKGYGTNSCPVIPQFPVILIFLGGGRLDRDKFQARIKIELDAIKLTSKVQKPQDSIPEAPTSRKNKK